MEKGRDEDNAEAREEERLANLKARNGEDFARFGSFRFADANEVSGGKASQHQTKRNKSTVEKPTVEVTRVLRSQMTRDVDDMPSDNIEEHEDHELVQETKGKKGKNALECKMCMIDWGQSHQFVWSTMDWVMGSAAKKWRDFKSELKTLYFDEKMTDGELQVVPDNRKKIEEKSNERPELLEKSIKQGDLFSHVAGKERNGYVRCIGLGPSAAGLGMPGTRKLKSTKLQMAEEEAKEALQSNAILVEHFNPDYDLSHSGYGYGYRYEGGYGGGHGGGYRHEDGYEGGYGGGYGHEGGYEHEGEYEHEETAESATRSHEVQQEKEATILHKKAEEALLQKKLTSPTQKNFVLSSTALHEVLQEKESTILQKKKATGLTQQIGSGQVYGKSRTATTSRLRRFPKGTQVDEGFEDFQTPEDLEYLQQLVE
uniref:Uncharacterized protein n=1 Tax=Aegilops tauschii TaxID=37682 RepID=N1R4G3_AEGTA